MRRGYQVKGRWHTIIFLLLVVPLVVLILTALAYPFVVMARRPGWRGWTEAFAVDQLGTNLWNDPDENVPVMCLGVQDGVCDKTMLDVHTNINVKTDAIVQLDAAMSAAQVVADGLANARYTTQVARAAQEEQERRDAEVWESESWKSQAGRDIAQDSRTVQQANDLRAERERAAASARTAADAAERMAVDAQLLRDAEARLTDAAERSAQLERAKQTALASGETARLAAIKAEQVVTEAAAVREAQAKIDADWAAADKAAYAVARKQQIIDDLELARIEAARLAEIARLAELARIEAERLELERKEKAKPKPRVVITRTYVYVPPPPPPPAKCFPADATVVLESGATIRMDALRVGDRVQALAPDGTLTFQPVYLFGHQSASLTSEFVGVLPAGNDRATLWLTPDHYLPVVSPASDPACFAAPTLMTISCARTVPAGWVKPGDIVFVAPGNVGCRVRVGSGGGAQKLEPVAVASVTRARKAGLYNPYTTGGWIIVDGAAASCHSDFLLEPVTPDAYKHLLPAVYQTLFAPLRALYAAVPSAFVIANAAAQAAHADGWNGLSVTQIVRIGATSIGAAMSVGRP